MQLNLFDLKEYTRPKDKHYYDGFPKETLVAMLITQDLTIKQLILLLNKNSEME
jgi:hypothetical protein